MNREIIKWNINSGPIIKDHVPRWESIVEKLDEGDKKGAGNLSRQYLEHLFVSITDRFEVQGTIKIYSKYEVGDLFGPVKKRFKNLLKEDESLKNVIESVLQTLEETAIMGNFLSHNNEISENISQAEVKSFANAVHNLNKVLQCKTCGRDLIYLQEQKLIQCSYNKCKNPDHISTR